MKTALFIILSLLSINNNYCRKQPELIKASSQKWKGGIEAAGYGTYYELSLIPNSSSKILTFDKLWIGEKYFEIQAFQKGKKMPKNVFAKDQVISIRVNDATIPKRNHKANKRTAQEKQIDGQNPPKYEGKALLSYLLKGKRKYIEIKEFTVLDPLFYP